MAKIEIDEDILRPHCMTVSRDSDWTNSITNGSVAVVPMNLVYTDGTTNEKTYFDLGKNGLKVLKSGWYMITAGYGTQDVGNSSFDIAVRRNNVDTMLSWIDYRSTGNAGRGWQQGSAIKMFKLNAIDEIILRNYNWDQATTVSGSPVRTFITALWVPEKSDV